VHADVFDISGRIRLRLRARHRGGFQPKCIRRRHHRIERLPYYLRRVSNDCRRFLLVCGKDSTRRAAALSWATYFGQSCSAETTALAVDAQQAVYVTGAAFPGLPVTSGAPQPAFGGGEHDAFMAKLDNAGANLLYCTYLGGSQNDSGTSIAVDSSGDAYATGLTQSTDLPVTGSALQTVSGGGYDAFVAELNSTGTAWQYLTYLGGQRDDYGYGIALDSSGDAYIAGYTLSNNLKVAEPVQPGLAGNQHVLYKTTASGKTWKASDTGLPFTPIVVAVDPASDSHWIAATSEGLYQSTDSGAEWQATSDFIGANMYGVAFSPAGGTVYASNFTQIYSSADSGNTWSFQGVAPCAAANLAVSPSSPTTLYLGYSCGAESIDGGQTWTTLNDLNGLFFNSIVIDPQSQSTIYAGTSSGLYGSTDGGQSWSALNIAGLQYPNVTSVAIDPKEPADVYTVANGSVYASKNSGGTWTLKSTGLTAHVNSLAMAPSKPAVLYAGTSAGIFVSTDSAAKWKAAGETIDSISLVAADAVASDTAYAATSVNPDAFVAKINPAGTALLYSTFLGGTGLDYALGIAFNSSGSAFVTGSAQSPDFPTTAGAFQKATGLSRTTAFVSSISTKTPACTYNASPASAFFYASGGPANFSVVAPSGCKWTPRASASWITVTSHGGPGVGYLAINVGGQHGRSSHRFGGHRHGKPRDLAGGGELQLLPFDQRSLLSASGRTSGRERHRRRRLRLGGDRSPALADCDFRRQRHGQRDGGAHRLRPTPSRDQRGGSATDRQYRCGSRPERHVAITPKIMPSQKKSCADSGSGRP
jgi:photosystem II stability/assembly factor-like uncharacterized protein